MLKSLNLAVLVWACASPGAQIAFSPVLESVWHRRCPETKIRVRETRRYERRMVYVLDACGELLEVEQRVRVRSERSMSREEAKLLAATLDQGPVPETIRAEAQALAADSCEPLSTARVLERPLTSARECNDSDVEILGSDDAAGVRRWWIRAGERIGVASFEWSRALR